MFSRLFRGPTDKEIATAHFANFATGLLWNLQREEGRSLAAIALGHGPVSFSFRSVVKLSFQHGKSCLFRGLLISPIAKTYFRHQRDIAALRDMDEMLQVITTTRSPGIVARAVPTNYDIGTFRPIAKQLGLKAMSSVLDNALHV